MRYNLPARMNREHVIARISANLAALSLEKGWAVEVKEVKSKRSLSQNAMLWALYQQIIELGGEAMAGWDKDDLHTFFLIEHFGAEVKEMFGKRRQVPLNRSSNLSKIEFSEFVDHIVRFMAEQGVYLDMPGDR